MRRGWRGSLCLACRRGTKLRLSDTYKEAIKKMEPGWSQWCIVRDDSQKLKEEWFRLGVRKSFYSVRTVKQQAKSPLRGCAVSILGGFQYLPGQSPQSDLRADQSCLQLSGWHWRPPDVTPSLRRCDTHTSPQTPSDSSISRCVCWGHWSSALAGHGGGCPSLFFFKEKNGCGIKRVLGCQHNQGALVTFP